MKIKRIKIKNYRNYTSAELELTNQKTIIIGKNAQGKTNILESIYFLSTLKSPRTTNNQELIKTKKKKAEITAIVEKNGSQTRLDYSLDEEKNKEQKINKVKTRPKEFKNVLKTVFFSTTDLLLLRGGPQDRRDWLDSAIVQIYPAYEERLSKYNKIRVQKNNFLKEYHQNNTLFEVYNEQLAILGSNIIYLRKKFLKEMEKHAKEKHLEISGTENLSIIYDCSFLEKEEEIEEILNKFQQKLKEKKTEEIKRGQSLIGPHRDDILFYINKQEATKYASQGQQRTIVLSLKLAELSIIEEKIGEPPVLLLDDVLAELDAIRQNYLLKTIGAEVQTIITSVDTLHFDKKFLKGVKIYKVEDGKIL